MHSTKNLTEQIQAYASELSAKGATDPLSWARSEATENIPQRARFYVLNEFSCLARTVESTVGLSSDHDENALETYKNFCSVLGKDRVDCFLIGYGKGIISGVIDIIDNGNYGSETVGWVLSETDSDGEITGRAIGGLHEDWLDFNT